MLSLLLATTLFAAAPAIAPDPGQHARPQRHDPRGLLRVEPTYYETAAATGGDFYFWAPGEFATSGLQLHLSDEPVMLEYGTSATPRRSVSIPVESGARRLTVFAGAQRKDRAVLVRPDGSIVAAVTGVATLQSFSHMLIATIPDPAPGLWRLEFDGAGLHSISAHVRPADDDNAPEFVDFDFVEMGGRPGHEGWFPIQRELRAGETIHCEATVAGYATDVRFAFVAGDGAPLATPKLIADPEYRENSAGECVIPARPFRIVVTGRDRKGAMFRRIEPALRTPR